MSQWYYGNTRITHDAAESLKLARQYMEYMREAIIKYQFPEVKWYHFKKKKELDLFLYIYDGYSFDKMIIHTPLLSAEPKAFFKTMKLYTLYILRQESPLALQCWRKALSPNSEEEKYVKKKMSWSLKAAHSPFYTFVDVCLEAFYFMAVLVIFIGGLVALIVWLIEH